MLWMLLGCAAQEIGYETLGCEGWDFEEGAEPSLELLLEEDAVTVSRVGIERSCGEEFEPQVTLEGKEVYVIESWVGGQEDCEACTEAVIRLYNLAPGDYKVYWYDDSGSVYPTHEASWSVQ